MIITMQHARIIPRVSVTPTC